MDLFGRGHPFGHVKIDAGDVLEIGRVDASPGQIVIAHRHDPDRRAVGNGIGQDHRPDAAGPFHRAAGFEDAMILDKQNS